MLKSRRNKPLKKLGFDLTHELKNWQLVVRGMLCVRAHEGQEPN